MNRTFQLGAESVSSRHVNEADAFDFANWSFRGQIEPGKGQWEKNPDQMGAYVWTPNDDPATAARAKLVRAALIAAAEGEGDHRAVAALEVAAELASDETLARLGRLLR